MRWRLGEWIWPSSATGDIRRVRAAANSMASGTPSRARHSAAMAAACESSTDGGIAPTADARHRNSSTAGPPGATDRPVRCTTRSLLRPSRLRLVTRMVRLGTAARISAMSSLIWPTCSTESSTSRRGSVGGPGGRGCVAPCTVVPWTRVPAAASNRLSSMGVDARRIASVAPVRSRSASGTKTTGRLCRRATSITTRVLPTPPSPVTVTRPGASTIAASRTISGSRPTNVVSGEGRVLAGPASGSSGRAQRSTLDATSDACSSRATRPPDGGSSAPWGCPNASRLM